MPDQPEKFLTDRIILVTGAAEGVGRAVALGAAAAGATLVLCDKEEKILEPVYDAIEEAGGAEPAILPFDPSKLSEDEAIGFAHTLGETFRRLDALVHCQAFAPFLSRIDDYDLSEFERTLRINLTTPFLLTQACMPLLRASESAAVVFTSDRVGRQGLAYWGAFAAAKFGIEGLSQVLAEETSESSNIRVNAIDPGVLRTGLRARLYPGENPKSLPEPDTVVPRYLELLRADAVGTGQVL